MKIACIQLNSQADMAANILLVEQYVAQAAAEGARFVTLPENAFFMRDPADKSAFTTHPRDQHPAVVVCSRLARQYGIWLLAGSVALPAGEGKSFNSSLLFDNAGNIIAHYDKIHLFDVTLPNGEIYAESSRFQPGEKAVVADTPWGGVGLTVCYDVRFPQLYRALAKAGASIITVPAAFTQVTGEAHWHILLRARAIEQGCFIVAPAQTGTHPGGRKTFGHSLIIDPWGTVLADGGTQPGIITAEIDLSQVELVRSRLPSLEHDRNFTL